MKVVIWVVIICDRTGPKNGGFFLIFCVVSLYRNVLGSIHQLTISEDERESGSTSEEKKVKEAVPVKTLLDTLTGHGQSRIDVAMVMIDFLVPSIPYSDVDCYSDWATLTRLCYYL